MAKMKAYASFDDYLRDQTPKSQSIIRALRRFVKRAAPGLSEAVKWGNGCWVGEHEGKGEYVRHTKVRAASDIDEPAFAALLLQAVRGTRPRS